MRKYSQQQPEFINSALIQMAMEQINIMLDTEWGKQLRMRMPHAVLRTWKLFENCGVYSLVYMDGKMEFYLVEKKYSHGLKTLREMLNIKLSANHCMMADDLLKKIKTQMATDKFW